MCDRESTGHMSALRNSNEGIFCVFWESLLDLWEKALRKSDK